MDCILSVKVPSVEMPSVEMPSVEMPSVEMLSVEISCASSDTQREESGRGSPCAAYDPRTAPLSSSLERPRSEGCPSLWKNSYLLKNDLMYSRFSFAMNLTLIDLGQAASHS